MSAPAEIATCRALLEGIAARDRDAIAACFADDAEVRALTPHQLRELTGPEAISERYLTWLGSLEPFELLSADTERVADRVRIRYRFRGIDAAHGPQENEHTGYAAVEGGRIVALNLCCAGFRPVPADGSPAGAGR